MQDDEQQFDIGNQDHFDNAPDEFKDHLMKAFLHAAGKGQHPGKYAGPKPEPPPDDAISEGDLQRVHEEPPGEEVSAKKMHAAQTGGSGLGPSGMDTAAVKQRDAIQQGVAAQGQQAAAKAQGAQSGITAPPAPTGPVGVTKPYPAQAGPQPQAPAMPPKPMPPPPEEPDEEDSGGQGQ